MSVIFLVSIFISLAVAMRFFDRAIIGDTELVQYVMVVIVMLGLPYVQEINAHISIGLLVDRLSERTQRIFDAFTLTLTSLVCMLIGFVNFEMAIHYFHTYRTGILIKFPLYPLVFVIAIGFVLWALVSLVKLVRIFIPPK